MESPVPEGIQSQDSQAILEALKAEFGVAATSIAYDDDSTREQLLDEKQDHSRKEQDVGTSADQAGNVTVNNDPPPQLSVVEQLSPAQAPNDDQIILVGYPHTDGTTHDAGLDESIRLVDTQRISQITADEIPNTLEAPAPVPPGTVRPSRTMDAPSQQSPTQANEDRDYREYCNTLNSSPNAAGKDTQDEAQSLQPDETGAVNFANLTDMPRPSSQVSEDAGFETTKGEWRITDQTPQHVSSLGYTPHRPQGMAPETPALPRNPFAAKPNIAAPFAGSQLFGQTQLSSAMKRVSPTSSRPSPNMFLNSISPNIMETSPLKDRANVSSPTDLRTSSPQRLHEIPSTVLRAKPNDDELETPLNSRSTGADLVPESPSLHPAKSSGVFQPQVHYEPMKKSQERKMVGDTTTQDLDSAGDSDDAVKKLKRRKRIQKLRAVAAEEMERVIVTRLARRASDEPPSRKKRRTMSEDGSLKGSLELANPTGDAKDDAHGSSSKMLPPSGEIFLPNADDTTPRGNVRSKRAKRTSRRMDLDGPGDEEVIPATSPVQSSPPDQGKASGTTEPELPELPEETESEQEEQAQKAESSSLPPTRRRVPRTYSGRSRRPRTNPFLTSSTSEVPSMDATPNDSHSPAPRLTRSAILSKVSDERRDTAKAIAKGGGGSSPQESEPSTPRQMPLPQPVEISSDLTLLSNTPAPSSATTPGTQDSPKSERTDSAALPSPALRTSLRKRVLRQAPKSVSPPAKRVSRASRRSLRLGSESTDELQCSPAIGGLDTSLAQPQASRIGRQSLSASHAGGRLFEGMVFAVSFQSNQKQQERAKLESRIAQAGGLVLQDGFHELFEPCKLLKSSTPVYDSDDLLKLTKLGCDSGFTALIADSHSRKPKYMQALALGLPCLAQQWVAACLNKGTIVDWQPYLLCAGSSAVLGNAVRSRNMAAYSVLETSLAAMVEARPRFLDGQRILIVVDSRKSRSEAKEPYIFLAQALGPSMSRVFTVQQAQEVLREHERAGKAFDWLYIDKATGSVDAILASDGKKRRRSAPKRLVGNIRVLDDELVIQSLILGRIVEEDEFGNRAACSRPSDRERINRLSNDRGSGWEKNAMVSTRSFWAASCAVLPALIQTVLGQDDRFTYPTQEGLTFYEKDTVLVSYETTIANVSLWTFCWEAGDDGKDVLRTKKVIGNAEDMNGSEAILIDFQTDSDNCWFNFRDNTDGRDKGGKPRGKNSVAVKFRSQPREKQTVWRLSDEEEKEEEQKPEESQTTSSEAAKTTTTTQSGQQAATISAAPSAADTSSNSQTVASTQPTTAPQAQPTSSTPGESESEGSEGSDNQANDQGGLSTGAKIGAAVGGVLGFLALAAVGVVFWLLRRRRRAGASPAPTMREMDGTGSGERDFKDPQLVGYYATPGGHRGESRGYDGGGPFVELNDMHKSPSMAYKPAEMYAQVPAELPSRMSHLPTRMVQELPG
ncbi:DNA repair protein crb2 [Paramyrothecium foliicola]|nr:DNA repair protein crb2 [Paramyrothecium foliicola]